MTLDLLKRSEKGAPLNATEHDANFTAIENAANAFVSINGHIETVANKTYVLILKAPTAQTINSLTTDCASGSCTAAVQIDGVNVTGLSALAVNTTETETNATAANTVAVGTTVAIVITGNSTCLDFWFTLKMTP